MYPGTCATLLYRGKYSSIKNHQSRGRASLETFWLCSVLSAAGRHAQATRRTHTYKYGLLRRRSPSPISIFSGSSKDLYSIYCCTTSVSSTRLDQTGNTPCADALRSAAVLISPSATAIHHLVDVTGQVAYNAGASLDSAPRCTQQPINSQLCR